MTWSIFCHLLNPLTPLHLILPASLNKNALSHIKSILMKTPPTSVISVVCKSKTPSISSSLPLSLPASLLSHHVGVGSAWHALTGVEVEEFVDLWGGQSVSNLQLLNDEHLPGEGLLAAGTNPDPYCRWSLPILPRYCHWVGLMLEGHLEDKTGGMCRKRWCLHVSH